MTHLIVAAVHLNDNAALTLNDDPDTAPKFDQLWSEVADLQASGVPVLALLGGAAKGSYARLETEFERYYSVLASFLRRHTLSGIDLDVEEQTSLQAIIRLIDHLRADFGPSFLITLAPVLTALVPYKPHLSGFSYFALDAMRGADIAWYNSQLYNGWGDASVAQDFMLAIASGWDPRRVVLGLVTSPENGSGFVPLDRLGPVVAALRAWCAAYPGITAGTEGFGGVMGWEYFNSHPEGRNAPWLWAETVGSMLAAPILPPALPPPMGGRGQLANASAPFPGESIATLTELGFSRQQAVAALNVTDGNVELAAGMLLDG